MRAVGQGRRPCEVGRAASVRADRLHGELSGTAFGGVCQPGRFPTYAGSGRTLAVSKCESGRRSQRCVRASMWPRSPDDMLNWPDGCGTWARPSTERLRELVSARMERQSVIGRTYLTAIIDQHVLHRLIGSSTVMAEQCAHLAAVAERPDIALHVIPDGTNVGLWGAFDMAARDSTVTVRLEAVEDMTSTAPDLVGKVTVAFERILGAAMPCAESLALIRAMEEQWKTQI